MKDTLMANPSPVVTVTGELRRIVSRELTDKNSGEIRTAYIALILTEIPDDDGTEDSLDSGFAEVYVAPEYASHIPTDKVRGREVALVCRAYAQNRNFGSQENPRFGSVLGLSYVSGSWGLASADDPARDSAVSTWVSGVRESAEVPA